MYVIKKPKFYMPHEIISNIDRKFIYNIKKLVENF